MLVQLNITNFAIIRHLELSLGQGLNTLSGETGAGKSIIITAINLIRGGRSSADLIRTGCNESTVEALFSLPQHPAMEKILADAGIPFDGELLIKRSIFREGRNKVFINGTMATLEMLSTLTPGLISVSGQHEHQLLLKPDNHLHLLDRFSGLQEERSRFQALFRQYQSLNQNIHTQEKTLREQKERQELAKFQMEEIEIADPSPGEDETLAEERTRLQHAEDLLQIASEGYQSLYERHDSVISAIARSIKSLNKGAEMDPNLVTLRDALSEVEAKLEDIAFSLRDFQKTVHIDPRQLEQVTERLDLLNRLKRKYGRPLRELMRFKEELADTLNTIDQSEEALNTLKARRDELFDTLVHEAGKLSRKRRRAAEDFETAVEGELAQLQMKDTRFKVRFDQAPGFPTGTAPGPDGVDKVEFMISPNVGEALRPLSKIVSGGELSRILLALKTILASTGTVETLIFDEVDSGVSGATAQVVGEKLSALAGYHQILCITHLPQIASQGHTHFLATKAVANDRTQATIRALDAEARIKEIARLLGGRKITSQALAHAREMLNP
ncbi:MAG: DNA repair protein RecN [Desulfatiglandaceae bacterium]